MKKLHWMPALLTAAAMSVATAYAQDAANESDVLEPDADANVELDAGQDEAQADTWDEQDSEADTSLGDTGSEYDSEADTAAAGSEQSGEAQLSATEEGQNHEFKDFSEVDKDGNGLLGIEEARDALPQHMTLVDTDGDGTLDRDEAEAAMPEVSFTGGSPNEPVGPNDYQTIQQQLESVSGAPSPGTAVDSPDSLDEDSQSEQSDDQEAEIDASADLG